MESENRQMTKEEVLQATIDVLCGIRVPISEQKNIADPIIGVIHNLLIVQKMMEAEKRIEEETAGVKEAENPGQETVLGANDGE